jgi:Gp19/Gp15/Gp42-like protein
MAIATVDDVTARWGQTADTAMTALIEKRLGDVERMIERRFKAENLDTIAAQITAGDIDAEDVEQVEAEAVLRLVRNPEGFLSENDGSYGYQVIQSLASGVLEITDDEWLILGVTAHDGFFLMVPTLAKGT